MQLRPVPVKGIAKSTLATALASLLLLLALASVDESLHQAIHKHTRSDDTCAVRMVANGLLEAPGSAAVLPIIILLAVYTVPVLNQTFLGRSEFLLPPGRAPPAFCTAS